MPGAVVVAATRLGGGALPLAAGVGVEAACAGLGPVLLAELSPDSRRRGPTLLAAPSARRLEAALRDAGLDASARGHVCHLALPASAEGLAELAGAVGSARLAVVLVPAELWAVALDYGELEPAGGLLRVELPRERSLAALAAADLRRRGLRAAVASRPLSALAGRRALAGLRPGGSSGARLARLCRLLLPRSKEERGQALPAVLGAGAAIVLLALLLSAIGGAVTGKARVQRAADLAALSAARSMRDEVPRLLAPPRLPDGSPNPAHLSRAAYLGRARRAALDAARRNHVDPGRLRVAFPDADRWPPLRARVRVAAEIDPRSLPGGERLGEREARPIRMQAVAVAEASLPTGPWSGLSSTASGGGYSGPLLYRHGEGMRPDVAAAFDRMAAAARRAGHLLLVTSGYRSDVEQAELFAQNPDPTWVAPPGRSLHRCATELDLGPSSAYGWLAANARRFGLLRRYPWEPWHFGFVAGPPPCSAAGEAGGASGDGAVAGAALPAFVPARYRGPILRSAARWNVSAALLAAQLQAESGFNPRALSPAGAQGIAQFMPGTAASYGLRDPFDPVAAIDAQAHLMSDLLRRFRAIPLALAAYNAGPGAVAGCSCVPPYPETRAYVTRILALLDGSGAILSPPLGVRLVR